jgi:WD40 repeat protein
VQADGRIVRLLPDGREAELHRAIRGCAVDSGVVSPDGTRAVLGTSCSGEYARMLSLDGGPDVGAFGPTGDDWIDLVSWAPDGSRFASVNLAQDEVLHVWDRAGVALASWDLRGGRILGVAWSPDGRWIALALEPGEVWVVDAETGAPRSTFGHIEPGEVPLQVGRAALQPMVPQSGALAWSPDSRLLGVGMRDGGVWILPFDGKVPIARFAGTHGQTDRVAFSPDGEILYSAYRDGVVRVWELADIATPGDVLLERWRRRLGVNVDGGVLVGG